MDLRRCRRADDKQDVPCATEDTLPHTVLSHVPLSRLALSQMAEERSPPDISWTETRFAIITVCGSLDLDIVMPCPPEGLYTVPREHLYTGSQNVPPRQRSDDVWLSLCMRQLSLVLSYWSARVFNKWKPRWLAQSEKRIDRYVLHVALEYDGPSAGAVFYRHLSHIKNGIVTGVYGGKQPFSEEWFSTARDDPLNGPAKMFCLCHVVTELFQTDVPALLYAWTNMHELGDVSYSVARKRLMQKAMSIGSHERRVASEELMQQNVHVHDSVDTETVVKKSKKETFKCTVERLVELGITNEKQWAQKDPASYVETMRTSILEKRARRAIRVAKQYITSTKNALDYVLCSSFEESDDITTNPVFSMLIRQGFDPREVGSIMLLWLGSRLNRYNTLWFHGSIATCNDLFIDAVMKNIPMYAVMSGALAQRDFWRCADTMAIWWKDAKPSKRCREVLSCILNGVSVSVTTCDRAVNISTTPCIVTCGESFLDACESQEEHDKMCAGTVRLPFTKECGFYTAPMHVSKFLSWCKPLLEAGGIDCLLKKGKDDVMEVKRYSVLELNEKMKRYL